MSEQRESVSLWHRLVAAKIGRRAMLTGLAAGTATAISLPLELQRGTLDVPSAAAAALPEAPRRALANPRQLFQPTGPSSEDDLILPAGYRYHVVAAWQDDLGGGQQAGYNHDWVGYYPI
jgi:secreted PhoX family phosphatase